MPPLEHIYLDSRFKTSDLKSHAEFSYDLGSSYDCPDKTPFYIDDVNIPNAWYSVEEGKNNMLYLRWKDETHDIMVDDIIPFPSNICDGDEFVKALN